MSASLEEHIKKEEYFALRHLEEETARLNFDWDWRWSPATTVSRRRTLKILKRRRRKEMRGSSDVVPLIFQMIMIVN